MKKKSFLIIFTCVIIFSFFLINTASATPTACPADNTSASAGTCGLTPAVSSDDGWCCKDTTTITLSEYETPESGYCGGKYVDAKWKCVKKKTTTTPPASGGAGAGASDPAYERGSTSLASVNPLGTSDISTVIGRAISGILGIVGAVALFMFVYGGIILLTSAGNPEKVGKGKNIITWSIIGLMVIMGSYAMVDFTINAITGTGGGGAPSGGSSTPDSACATLGGSCITVTHSDGTTDCTKEANIAACITDYVAKNDGISSCVRKKCSSPLLNVVCCIADTN